MNEAVRQEGGVAAAALPLAGDARKGDAQKKEPRARGLGRIYARGSVWWVQVRYRGELYRESTGSTLRAKAVSLLKKRLGEMGQGRLVGHDSERTSFEDLATMLTDDYVVNGRRSLDRAQRSIRKLREVFGHSRALEITADRISAYVRARLEVAKPGTVRLELAALGRMFTLAVRAGRMTHRPYLPPLQVHNTRTGFFEPAELQAVLAQLPADIRVLIEFLAATGWRVGEAKGLMWRNVDFAAGVVKLDVGSTKNGEGRTFPFAAMPRLEELLREQREHTSDLERQNGRLIANVFHRGGRPIQSFHMAWTAACRRAGVPGRLVHDLRRTAVRNLERAGVSRSVAMKLTGHKTEAVYRRYAIVSEADLAEGVRKLAALGSGEGRGRAPSAASHEISRMSTV